MVDSLEKENSNLLDERNPNLDHVVHMFGHDLDLVTLLKTWVVVA